LWDCYEHWISRRNEKRYRSFPLPSAENRRHDSSNVSIIVPTINTETSFATCLCGLLKNNPRQVIIVTTEAEEQRVKRLVYIPSIEAARGKVDLKILSIPRPNKRDQLVLGIKASSGNIIALVNDDAFWDSNTVLYHLLAPFQQKDVGLVGGPIT
jgi:hypothetical protein